MRLTEATLGGSSRGRERGGERKGGGEERGKRRAGEKEEEGQGGKGWRNNLYPRREVIELIGIYYSLLDSLSL